MQIDFDVKSILEEEFDSIRLDLIAKHNALGMKASGKWIESLEVRASSHGAELWGANYTEQLVKGRAPGAFPNITAIKQWIIDKPIQSELSISTLAFLIARKIAKEGTQYYKQGGTDLIESVITPQRIQKILDRISHVNVPLVSNVFSQAFRNLAA